MIKKILLLVMKPTILVGGQAVIEGVMMRVPGAYATAVRDPNGKVHFDSCLLYTSPSPRDGLLSRMPSSA